MNNAGGSIRVAVVDDHQIVRTGLVTFLKSVNGFKFVGEAASGEEVVGLCQRAEPDVILMDLVMPGISGVEATQRIRDAEFNTQVVVLTTFDDPELVQGALDAGAIGYLLKHATTQQITDAIVAAHEGTTMLAPEATRALIANRKRKSTIDAIELTERELEVLDLLCDGLTNPQIAERLFLSRATIKFYVRKILSKFNATTRTEAVAFALENQIIKRD